MTCRLPCGVAALVSFPLPERWVFLAVSSLLVKVPSLQFCLDREMMESIKFFD